MSVTVLSSKGQLILPARIRSRRKFKSGSRFDVKDTPYGIMLIPVPDNPVRALRGIASGMGITYDEVKKMRLDDDKKRLKKLDI